PAHAKAVANAFVAIRQNPSLPKANITTQEILLSAVQSPKVPVGKGSTLRMGTIDVAAPARAMGYVTDDAAPPEEAPPTRGRALAARSGRAPASLGGGPVRNGSLGTRWTSPPPPEFPERLALPLAPPAAIARTPAPGAKPDPRAQAPIPTNRLPSTPAI